MPSLRLDRYPTKPSRPARIAWGAFLALLLAAGVKEFYDGAFVVLPWLIANPPESAMGAPGWLAKLCLTPIFAATYLLLPIFAIVSAVRPTGEWLTGTVLSTRSMIRTRSVDLAEADMHGEVVRRGDGTGEVILVARPPVEGIETRLVLGSLITMLPREQLEALADAIAAGDPDDPGRRRLVERLRRYWTQRYPAPEYLWENAPRPAYLSPVDDDPLPDRNGSDRVHGNGRGVVRPGDHREVQRAGRQGQPRAAGDR